MAKHRLHPGLVALSASAIAAVYTVGYVHTQTVDSAIAAVLPTTVATPFVSVPTATITTPSGAIAQIVVSPTATTATRAATATAVPTPTTTASTATYKDGTFSGSGTSRFGDVQVAVTVVGGKISNVALTKVTTKYPASRIAALPGQVIARQTAQVDNVSGATASATAFRTAVQAALALAK